MAAADSARLPRAQAIAADLGLDVTDQVALQHVPHLVPLHVPVPHRREPPEDAIRLGHAPAPAAGAEPGQNRKTGPAPATRNLLLTRLGRTRRTLNPAARRHALHLEPGSGGAVRRPCGQAAAARPQGAGGQRAARAAHARHDLRLAAGTPRQSGPCRPAYRRGRGRVPAAAGRPIQSRGQPARPAACGRAVAELRAGVRQLAPHREPSLAGV